MTEEQILELVSLEHLIMQAKIELDNLTKREDEIKQIMLEQMANDGIDVFENEEIRIKYIAPVVRETIDTSKLKKEYPDIAHSCLKQNEIKANWKITLKGE